MTILSKAQLTSNVQSELADNNAGLISAADVRHNMEDILDSMNQIVASGNFDATNPFTGSNVRAKIKNGLYGSFVVESGIIFPNAGGATQYVPYPGPSGISHNSLSGLTTGDVHTQYLPRDGSRAMSDNLGMSNNWLNSSGTVNGSSNNRGLNFQYVSTNVENIHVGSGSKFTFDLDGSQMNSAHSVAKAWISFDASGVGGLPVVNSSYNIHTVQHLDIGKFKIFFNSGVLKDNNYVAMGTSSARSTAGSQEDFEMNTVGTILRAGNDASSLRNITFCVLNTNGEYVDAQVNDLIIFGRGANSTGTSPIVSGIV